jgi:hypothetical protein
VSVIRAGPCIDADESKVLVAVAEEDTMSAVVVDALGDAGSAAATEALSVLLLPLPLGLRL